MLAFLGIRAANCGAPLRMPGAPGSGANDATMHAHIGHSHACADGSSALEDPRYEAASKSPMRASGVADIWRETNEYGNGRASIYQGHGRLCRCDPGP